MLRNLIKRIIVNNKKPNNGPKQHDWPTDNKPAPRPVTPRPVASAPAPTEKIARKN